jgi:alkaline phosphatase D
MDRRSFLRSTAWFTVASAGMGLSACNSASNVPAAVPGTYTFSHGVASGDPREGSVVFWTRCVPAAGSQAVSLRLEVAADAAFSTLVARVQLNAVAAYDYTVRAKVTGLASATRYWYRFVAGVDTSPAGQARTAPAAGAAPAQLRFGWMTCQDWKVNHWGALELLAAEDLDFVVHLGDYVYETTNAVFQPGAAEPAHGQIVLPNGVAAGASVYANSLEDYRTLYRTYRGDARLQEVHRKFPMIVIWDDHEFSDDCWQDHQTYTNANEQQTARRRSANQAWAEYMPVDWGDITFDLNNTSYDNIRIYRDFRFGNLLHLVMTDERLYRDDHVARESDLARVLGHDPLSGNDSIGTRYLVPQQAVQLSEAAATAALGRIPSILGSAQTQWWKNTMQASGATWKVWGNEVTLNRMWLDLRTLVPEPYAQKFVLNADSWDGYPSHRAELLTWLRSQNIGNVVAITGDLHAFQCGVLYDNADPETGTPVALDFVSAGISSTSFYQYLARGIGLGPLAALLVTPALLDQLLRRNNPALAYADYDAQGYAVATVTPAAFSVEFTKVRPLNPDGSKPAAPLAGRTRITVGAGTTTPVVEENLA